MASYSHISTGGAVCGFDNFIRDNYGEIITDENGVPWESEVLVSRKSFFYGGGGCVVGGNSPHSFFNVSLVAHESTGGAIASGTSEFLIVRPNSYTFVSDGGCVAGASADTVIMPIQSLSVNASGGCVAGGSSKYIYYSKPQWMRRLLSPIKNRDARWVGLAKAIETYWEENFDNLHSDLVNLRSIYTMTSSDLALKMREKGDYFQPDWPTEFDQPLAVAWREGEVLRKSTEYVIKSTLRRNFRNIKVEWMELYAPKVGVYGSSFVHKKTSWDEDDYWLTSRGKISVDLDSMYSAGGWSMSTFSPVVGKIVRKIKPLHIVYDGVIFEWNSSHVIEEFDSNQVKKVKQRIVNNIEFIKRYDIIRADDATTDENEGAVVAKNKTVMNIRFDLETKLQGPLLDEIQLDAMQLDYDFFGEE